MKSLLQTLSGTQLSTSPMLWAKTSMWVPHTCYLLFNWNYLLMASLAQTFFTYTAVDSNNLESDPATVTFHVTSCLNVPFEFEVKGCSVDKATRDVIHHSNSPSLYSLPIYPTTCYLSRLFWPGPRVLATPVSPPLAPLSSPSLLLLPPPPSSFSVQSGSFEKHRWWLPPRWFRLESLCLGQCAWKCGLCHCLGWQRKAYVHFGYGGWRYSLPLCLVPCFSR